MSNHILIEIIDTMKLLKMKLLIVAILLGLCNPLVAQKANYKQAHKFSQLKEIRNYKISPNFLKDSDKFWYVALTEGCKKYHFVDPLANIKKPLFDNKHMATELTKYTGVKYNVNKLPLAAFKFNADETTFSFSHNGLYFAYNIETGNLEQAEQIKRKKPVQNTSKPWMSFSPDKKWIVYAREHDLYLKKANDNNSKEIRLTFDGEQYYSYSNSGRDTSSRNTRSGAKWFKDSKKLYILRKDERKLEELYLVDVLKGKKPVLNTIRYAMPGDKNVTQFDLKIVDVESKKLIDIDVAKWKDQNLSDVFAPSESDRIYFMRKKRTCDEVDICVADTETGKSNVLINEISKPYFNEQLHSLKFLNDGEDIIWWSERDGWGHYYLYDKNGQLKNRITKGKWVAGKIVNIDIAGRTLFFEAHGKEKGVNPYYSMLCHANIDGKFVRNLTKEDATHSCRISKSRKFIIDTYSRVDQEPVTVLKNSKGKVLFELGRPDLKKIYDTGWKMPERFKLKAADGKTDLYGVMWKPFDFDPNKKYPIISNVYPGPQTETVPAEFTVNFKYNTALAQLGCIVVCMGHRGGSPLRNKAYHTFGYDNLRDYALADDKYAIEQLAERFSFIDISKVGIHGRSGGGAMSTAAICTYPDFYSVAVSMCGNHDNRIYNRWWGESHHGIKEIKKIEKDSLGNSKETTSFEFKVPTSMELAKNLKGNLLLMTGDVDNNVHPGNTYRLIDALIKANKNFDFCIVPGARHIYSGKARSFVERKMWFHFAKHLLGDYRADDFTELDEYNCLN